MATVWFRGSDSKLWVCWWGGSSYLAGPLTAADCSSDVVVDPVTHYCWYKGTDSRLRVCWYGGGWNNGPVTGATCASNVCIDHNNHYIWFQGTDRRLWVCWYSGGWLNGSVTPANCQIRSVSIGTATTSGTAARTASSMSAGGAVPAISVDPSPLPIAHRRILS